MAGDKYLRADSDFLGLSQSQGDQFLWRIERNTPMTRLLNGWALFAMDT